MTGKLWLVVGGCGWCWWNYGWSWTGVISGGKILVCLWVAVDGCGWCRPNYGWSWLVVGDFSISLYSFLNSKCVTREKEHFIFKEKWIQWAWLVDWYWSLIDPWGKISEETENSVRNGSSNKYNHSCTCQFKVCFSIFSQITILKSLMSQFNALVLLKFTISPIYTILKFLLR